MELPPSPEGDSKHKFVGWFLVDANGNYTSTKVSDGDTVTIDSSVTADETVKVYAKFAEQFKVTLYTTKEVVFDTVLSLGGGVEASIKTPETAMAEGLPVAPNQKMVAWTDADGNRFTDKVTVNASDIDLWPVLVNVHQVSFVLLKTVFEPLLDQHLFAGDKVIQPTQYVVDQVYTGYTFGGWYLDDMFGQPYDFTNPIEESDPATIYLYAKWTPVKVTYTIQAYREKQNDPEYELGDTILLRGYSEAPFPSTTS